MEIVRNKNGSVSYKEKIYLSNGRTETKTFLRKTDARNWKRYRQIEKSKITILGLPPLKDELQFSEIFDFWLKSKIQPVRSFKTWADYKCIGRKHLRHYFGKVGIRAIEQSHADLLIEKLKVQGLANKTVNKILAVFKQVLKFAEVHSYIHANPLRNFPMLPLGCGRMDFLTRQEILKLLKANALEQIYPILVLAINTGMRIGEITGLCWDRVNFDTSVIEVSRTMTRQGLKETTKTNLVRYIPMNPEVRDALWSLLKEQKSIRFVFVDKNANPFNPDHFSQRHFLPALNHAGVRTISFHILRHTYASTFMMNGGNIYDLQKILGHTKVEMTMVYAHLSPQHLAGIVGTVRYSANGDKSDSPYLALSNGSNGVKEAIGSYNSSI